MTNQKSIKLLHEKSLFEICLNNKICLLELIIYNENEEIKNTVKFNIIRESKSLTDQEKDEIFGIISELKL